MVYLSAGSADSIRQLIYLSRTVREFSAAGLLELLEEARKRNARSGITGLLVHRKGTFLQLIEGPARSVDAVLHRIRKDHRHADLTVLSDRVHDRRLFPEWSMGFEEVEQVIPQTWPGLSQVLPPSLPFQEWIRRPGIAVSFFESCSLGAWSPRNR